jgi:putative endonuclease
MLVWYEVHINPNLAIAREKQIKGWNRAWKLKLIEKENFDWEDLFEGLVKQGPKGISEENVSSLDELLFTRR